MTEADLEEIRRGLADPRPQELERTAMKRFTNAVRALGISAESSHDPSFRRLVGQVRRMLLLPEVAPLTAETSGDSRPRAERSRLARVIAGRPSFLGSGRPATETDLALLFLALNPGSERKIDLEYAGGLDAAIAAAIAAEITAMSQARARWGRPTVPAAPEAGLRVLPPTFGTAKAEQPAFPSWMAGAGEGGRLGAVGGAFFVQLMDHSAALQSAAPAASP